VWEKTVVVRVSHNEPGRVPEIAVQFEQQRTRVSRTNGQLLFIDDRVHIAGRQVILSFEKEIEVRGIQLLLHIERRHGKRYAAELTRIEHYEPGQDRYEFKTLFERTERSAEDGC